MENALFLETEAAYDVTNNFFFQFNHCLSLSRFLVYFQFDKKEIEGEPKSFQFLFGSALLWIQLFTV